MTTSESINEIAGALAKAQGAMAGAMKDAENPFFKSRYADLASVWDACRKPLSDNGLAIVQSPSAEGSTVTVHTMLLHSSGQWMRGSITVAAKDDSPQAVGSATTYLRRYALQSFAGVAPEDDDAEAAQPRNGAEKQAARPQAASGAHFAVGDVGPLVVEKVGPGRASAKAEVFFTNGDALLTFSEPVAVTAKLAVKSGKAVTAKIEKSQSGNRYISNMRETATNGASLAPAKAEHGAPVTSSEIPF